MKKDLIQALEVMQIVLIALIGLLCFGSLMILFFGVRAMEETDWISVLHVFVLLSSALTFFSMWRYFLKNYKIIRINHEP